MNVGVDGVDIMAKEMSIVWLVVDFFSNYHRSEVPKNIPTGRCLYAGRAREGGSPLYKQFVNGPWCHELVICCKVITAARDEPCMVKT